MTRYYVDVDEELAERLEQVDEQDIIEVLTDLAEKEASSDELTTYNSVSDIMSDKSLTEAEAKRLKLKAERRSDISKR
jgi:hypothetical protein